ncbi:SanA/YdcF family protein [Nostocoides sp.]|uniref:SanA/YdcF family protein n=1 Tax=Nostocoides sp. TaxID=1917966 RepID=UPI003BB1E0F0
MHWRRATVATLLGAGVLGSAAVLGANVWAARASAGHAYAAELAPQRPVALVLGAGLTPAGTPTPYLAYRLDVAKQLYDAGTVRVLLVSGDNRTHAYDEPTAMTDYLVAHGIPEERIVQDFAGRDTYDSCARARRIFGVEQLIVVTQEYHVPRAIATCRALGIDAVGVGDLQGRRFADVWASGSQREKLAVVKTVWDLTTRRDPVLGQPESRVQDALAGT